MKKFFSVILCVTCALTLLAQTPDGLTCETAIPVDQSYQGTIDAPGVYYYTAWTYDLPLTCYFYPTSGDIESLYMDIDFTCNPGVYDDPNIAELADASFDLGMGLPMRFDEFALGYDSLGRKYYSLTVPESCREIMANFGITYNGENVSQIQAELLKSKKMTPIVFEDTTVCYSPQIKEISVDAGNGFIDFSFVLC